MFISALSSTTNSMVIAPSPKIHSIPTLAVPPKPQVLPKIEQSTMTNRKIKIDLSTLKGKNKESLPKGDQSTMF